MITFNQYLTETFNQAYTVKKVKADPGEHTRLHFKTDNGNSYHVKVHHYNEGKPNSHAEFSFHASDQEHKNHNTKINNSEGSSSTKVFSTMHHIMKNHLAKNKKINNVGFSASNKEPSRVRLYQHLSKHFAHKHEETPSGNDTSFKIHRNDMK